MEYFPSAELIVKKNAGHTLFGEKPTESLGAIRKYFEEN